MYSVALNFYRFSNTDHVYILYSSADEYNYTNFMNFVTNNAFDIGRIYRENNNWFGFTGVFSADDRFTDIQTRRRLYFKDSKTFWPYLKRAHHINFLAVRKSN